MPAFGSGQLPLRSPSRAPERDLDLPFPGPEAGISVNEGWLPSRTLTNYTTRAASMDFQAMIASSLGLQRPPVLFE